MNEYLRLFSSTGPSLVFSLERETSPRRCSTFLRPQRRLFQPISNSIIQCNIQGNILLGSSPRDNCPGQSSSSAEVSGGRHQSLSQPMVVMVGQPIHAIWAYQQRRLHIGRKKHNADRNCRCYLRHLPGFAISDPPTPLVATQVPGRA